LYISDGKGHLGGRQPQLNNQETTGIFI
jgi:hypothetical protein